MILLGHMISFYTTNTKKKLLSFKKLLENAHLLPIIQ